MNRAERRRLQKQGRKPEKEATLNLKVGAIQQMKQDATNSATDTAFLLMLAIPTMVLRDNYSKLTRREHDGKKRIERFTDMCLELYERFDRGEITVADLEQVLSEESGIKVEKRKR